MGRTGRKRGCASQIGQNNAVIQTCGEEAISRVDDEKYFQRYY